MRVGILKDRGSPDVQGWTLGEDEEVERRGRSASVRDREGAGQKRGVLRGTSRSGPWAEKGEGQRRGGYAQREPDVAHVMWAVAGMGAVGAGYAAVPGRMSQKPGGERGEGQLVQDPQEADGCYQGGWVGSGPAPGTGCG